MRKNTIIWKIANASLAFFISTSYVVSASETVELEGENQPSVSVSHHHSYEKIFEEIKELTARIHREVDKVLADYKRDTAEHHRRMGTITTMSETLAAEKHAEQDREKDFVPEKLEGAEGGKSVEIIPREKGGAESPKIQIPGIGMNQKEINKLDNKKKQEILREVHNFERDYSDTYVSHEIRQHLEFLVNGIVYSDINIPEEISIILDMVKGGQMKDDSGQEISDSQKEELIDKIENFKVSLSDIPGEPGDIIDQNPKTRTRFDQTINQYFTIQSEKSLDLQNDLDNLIKRIVMSKQDYQEREKEAKKILKLKVDDIEALSYQKKRELLDKIENFLQGRIGSREYHNDPNPRSQPYTKLLESLENLGQFLHYDLESTNNKEDESY